MVPARAGWGRDAGSADPGHRGVPSASHACSRARGPPALPTRSAGVTGDPQPTLAGLPETLSSRIRHFWAAAWPRDQGYGEASLRCPQCAEPPSPHPLTGTGREAEAHAQLPLPRQALPRPQLRPWPPPCWGMAAVGGRRVGRGDCGSPHSHILTTRRLRALLRVGPARQESLARAAGRELLPEEPSWGDGHRCPVRSALGDLWDPSPPGRCRGSGCVHGALGRTLANLLPAGARLSRDGPTSVPYWLLWPRDRDEKHHN